VRDLAASHNARPVEVFKAMGRLVEADPHAAEATKETVRYTSRMDDYSLGKLIDEGGDALSYAVPCLDAFWLADEMNDRVSKIVT